MFRETGTCFISATRDLIHLQFPKTFPRQNLNVSNRTLNRKTDFENISKIAPIIRQPGRSLVAADWYENILNQTFTERNCVTIINYIPTKLTLQLYSVQFNTYCWHYLVSFKR
jgi:hypothetical protein